MKVVGLTGGIGSGKSTVAHMFHKLGIPVYIADDEAKKLMNTSKSIRKKLIDLLGEEAYNEAGLNRTYIASLIFNDQALLQQINAIVHPKVKMHFNRWLKKQTTPYIIKEAAIIFENNLQDQYDLIITVAASEALRIKRVIKRDNSNREKVLSVIKNQWPDTKKMALSNYVIFNKDLEHTKAQVAKIHSEILKM